MRGRSPALLVASAACVALLTAACASGGSGSAAADGPAILGSASGGANVDFVRVLEPFAVLDGEGEPLDLPFFGGLNIPRPQLLDIDGDGDDDLFVQEASGSVMYFEHVPEEDPRFVLRSHRYQDLEVGEWYRFVDMDRDGDADLLAEEPFSYIRYYRNDGTPTDPRFVLAADTLKDTDGAALFSDRQNIPNATDIDCDGRIDLLIGRLTGTVTRYEETGLDADGVPRFQHLTDEFEGIEIVAQIGSRHGANTMALGDVDGDGDEDLFWGDFFEPGVLFIENTGTCRSPNLSGEPVPFPVGSPLRTSGYNAPTLGDVDDDGDEDLLVGVLGGAYNPNTTTADNFHWLEQVAVGRFEHRTSRFVSTIDVGSESVPVLVDLDGDGDLDLLVGNKIDQDDSQNGTLHRFVNEGSASQPRFRRDGELDVGGGYHLVPAFGDLDADGDLDAMLGTWSDELRLYTNDADDGSIALSLVDSAFVTLARGRNATPALGDLDGDGDLDLLVGESAGTLEYFENVGNETAPLFTLVADDFGDIDVGRRSVPLLRDLDADGDLDLLVGSESEGVRIFRNEGTPSAADFIDAGRLPIEDFGFAAPTLGDVDGDGDVDVLLGGGRGGLWYFENRRR